MEFGCQVWSLIKSLVKKLGASLRAMESRMLSVKAKDRIRNAIIRQGTRVTDKVEFITEGHSNRLDTLPKWMTKDGQLVAQTGRKKTVRPIENVVVMALWCSREQHRHGQQGQGELENSSKRYLLQWRFTVENIVNYNRICQFIRNHALKTTRHHWKCFSTDEEITD